MIENMIEYRCDNCGKRFKTRDYMRLEIVPQGRKCDSCGGAISVEDKIVKI